MAENRKKPTMICILDGWGYRDTGKDNAVEAADNPVWKGLLKTCPYTLIETSGLDVGLPKGQMGNSEVGHMNIGSGRIVMQDLPMIDAAFASGSIESNPVLLELIKTLKENGKTCHIMGLLSPGGVHSHQDHLAGMCGIMAKNGIKTVMHAFMDGRDTPPDAGAGYLEIFNRAVKGLAGVSIGTVSGRYYAMDRDNRWERVEKAYNAMVDGKGAAFDSAEELVKASYAAGVTDEFVVPAVVKGYNGMEDGDAFLMANFRSDRAREITKALIFPGFDAIKGARKVKFDFAASMAELSKEHDAWIRPLFPAKKLADIYGQVIADHGLTQLRIAETEKYAHVTFFFNGGEEAVFKGEDRILVPSPKVATYDLKPEMSAFEVTDRLVEAITSGRYDTIVVNYANGDMVGHTGIMPAAVKAVEAVDKCLERVIDSLRKVDGQMLLTADHGNCEMMVDPATGKPYTAHTVGKVYAILVNADPKFARLRDGGRLADLAPTLLDLMGIDQPAGMTGESLIVK